MPFPPCMLTWSWDEIPAQRPGRRAHPRPERGARESMCHLRRRPGPV